MKSPRNKIFDGFKKDFKELRDSKLGYESIRHKLEKDEARDDYLKKLMQISRRGDKSYPSQGLLSTPYDFLEFEDITMLSNEMIFETLRLRRYFLELFNHPYRIHFLDEVNRKKFVAPQKITNYAMQHSQDRGLSLSIGDFAAVPYGANTPHISRTDRYAEGPFVKLGRQARTVFVGSEQPDIWSTSLSIATMAASHCLISIPRNGLLSDVKRQSDIARESFELLEEMAEQILNGRSDRKKVLNYWKHNVMAAVEARPDKALIRAEAMYKAGIRTFRVYTPEPGIDGIETVKALRKRFDDEIEIFVGQLINVEQAILAEKAGADGIYLGIGGGGRCITGIRSGTAIDWPELVWNLRGEIGIPIIVQGGASDHVAVSLLLGVSGIGVSRAVGGGTIESPGGALFMRDKDGSLFKPYVGEASARTKYLDGKIMPFQIPAFVEGETTKAFTNHIYYSLPTLTYNLHVLIEDAVLSLVFRGCTNVPDMQALDPSPLRRITAFGEFQRNIH